MQRDAEEFLVEKQQGRLRLVLRRSRDVALDGRMREERLDFCSTQVAWMTPVLEVDVPLHLAHIDLLGPLRVMLDAEPVAQLVEQSG